MTRAPCCCPGKRICRWNIIDLNHFQCWTGNRLRLMRLLCLGKFDWWSGKKKKPERLYAQSVVCLIWWASCRCTSENSGAPDSIFICFLLPLSDYHINYPLFRGGRLEKIWNKLIMNWSLQQQSCCRKWRSDPMVSKSIWIHITRKRNWEQNGLVSHWCCSIFLEDKNLRSEEKNNHQ